LKRKRRKAEHTLHSKQQRKKGHCERQCEIGAKKDNKKFKKESRENKKVTWRKGIQTARKINKVWRGTDYGTFR
jgi:hypothetical protein